LENGHKEIGARTLQNIVATLDVSFERFFGGI
jgi:hypothetical protein